ncbi:very short patch repair endonuclease [Bacteroides sp.]|uniref:very short patch repair endonuclease n=1 Tax=Bacteroides sp. TaxID=29523 RepID=UPI0025BFB8D8|nr:very short patch repair endonuclease [Bacteroides sp.]
MTDVHSKVIRSYNMSRIKGQNTKPEIIVRKYLFSHGFRYRINVKALPGKPDIVLSKYKTVIFINGCFWHGHENCKFYVLPKTRTEWWKQKIGRNRERDVDVREKLRHIGWRTMVIWECQLKGRNKDKILDTIVSALNQAFIEQYKIVPKKYSIYKNSNVVAEEDLPYQILKNG